MDDVLRQLLAVQEKDQRISDLKQMIRSVPREKERIRSELQSADDVVAIAKAALQKIQSQINDLESNVQACQQRILQLQTKSREVKKNDEYRAIMAEVEGQKQKITEYEDLELELMEQVEGAKAELARAEKEHAAMQARIEAAQQDLDVREKNCKAQIEKIQAEREALAQKVPEDLLRFYSRLIAQSTAERFRKAVVPVENGGCGSCYLKIPPDLQLKAKTTHDATCGNCGAILYWPEDA